MDDRLLDNLPRLELEGDKARQVRRTRPRGVIYLPKPLKCPWCGGDDYEQYGTKIVGNWVKRYYFCKKSLCGRKFQTLQPLR